MGHSNGCGREGPSCDGFLQKAECRTKPIILIVVSGGEAEHGMRERASQREPSMKKLELAWGYSKRSYQG